MEILITIITLSLLLFIGGIFWAQNKRKKFTSKQKSDFQKHWSRIKISTNYNQAILDADKLLDKALKIKGFTGTTGEKMKRANPLFTHRNEVWAAHKLRNRIAHELNITITEKQFKATLHQFKTGLKDLGLNLK